MYKLDRRTTAALVASMSHNGRLQAEPWFLQNQALQIFWIEEQICIPFAVAYRIDTLPKVSDVTK